MRRTGIGNKVLLTVFDNGDRPISAKHLAKILDEPKQPISNSLASLRKNGFIEHRGYAKYVVTEAGRVRVGVILGNVERKADETAEVEAVEEAKWPPLEPSEIKGGVDWEVAFRDLAFEIAKRIGDKKEVV